VTAMRRPFVGHCGGLLHLKMIAIAVSLLAGFSDQALAWGYEGDRVAAEIAEQYLAPETARQVRALLALENATTLGALLIQMVVAFSLPRR
jgi:hypothetical protein